MRLPAPDDRSRVSGVAFSCKLPVCCFNCNWRKARCIVLMIGLRWAAYWITRGLAINPANPPWVNDLTLCTRNSTCCLTFANNGLQYIKL